LAESEQTGGKDGWIEVVIAIVLSVAGLMTSWSSYQASLWDGEQAAHYSQANTMRVDSSNAKLAAESHRAIQITLFNAWLQAGASGDTRLANFYEARFPPDLKPAFQAWRALNPLTNPAAPDSPFAMPDYRPAGRERGEALSAAADKAFDEGQKANGVSDVYTQGTVFLAMALFFGGIGQVFTYRYVRIGLLAIAVLSCAVGFAKVITLPTLSPG
jgi:hypothetical protein